LLRSRIVLLAADGLQNNQIAMQLKISTRMAGLCVAGLSSLAHAPEG
jgi:hypothetical protein